jgi:hypothetical protein
LSTWRSARTGSVSTTLRKLAPNLASHESIVKSDGLKSLFHLTAMKDYKLRRQAAVALRDLSANPEHKERFVQDGGYAVLLALCKDDSVELQTLAVASLRHLSIDDTLKRGIVQAGTLPVLLRNNAASNNADLQCQVAGLLANLSENIDNQISVVEVGVHSLVCAWGG